MAPATQNRTAPSDTLIHDLLASFDAVFGLHSGFRPVHAKGIMCPARSHPRPPRQSSPARPTRRADRTLIVRLSNFAGIPEIPDNHPEAASPRGMAIRFYLGEHIHTDIVAHSANGFPVRTGAEFLELNRASLPVRRPRDTHRRLRSSSPRTRRHFASFNF